MLTLFVNWHYIDIGSSETQSENNNNTIIIIVLTLFVNWHYIDIGSAETQSGNNNTIIAIFHISISAPSPKHSVGCVPHTEGHHKCQNFSYK